MKSKQHPLMRSTCNLKRQLVLNLDQRIVRNFLKDISHINFFKDKNSENIVFPRGMFFVSMFDIGQISDL